MLQKICRTCLALEGDFSSIYDSNIGSNCVADILGDITSQTLKKSDGMPKVVCLACIKEINRCYRFKIRCLNSESVLKQLLYSCGEDQNAAISYPSLEKRQDIIPGDEKYVGESYIVIDLKDENERLKIKQEVENQFQLRSTKEGDENADISLEEKDNAEKRGCILPHVDTPDVEFVENDKASCVVIDSDEEDQIGHDVDRNSALIHGEHVNISNADNPIERKQHPEFNKSVLPHIDTPNIEFLETAKDSYVISNSDEEKDEELLFCNKKNTAIKIERNAEATECIPPQHVTPDVEFVENEKVPCVFVDSDDEIEHMATENEVNKDLNLTLANTRMERKLSADSACCILPQEQDGTQDVDFVKTDDEPYIVIDLECESERLEIKDEVQKQLLYSNKGSENVEIPSEEMANVEPMDFKLVVPSKETYIVIDSEDEIVQFEIEHNVKQKSRPNIIRQYHSRKTASLPKVMNKPKPSLPMVSTAEETFKLSEFKRQIIPDEISDDFSHIFDYFDDGGEDLDNSNSGNVDSASVSNETNMPKKCGNNKTSPHQCPVCQDSFSHRLLLTHHMRLHPSGLRYNCSMCSMAFSNKRSLNDHILLHGENMPYKCKDCPQSFDSIKELRLHVREHTGDSPFVCNLCQPSGNFDNDLDCLKTDRHSDRKENGVIIVDDDTACSSSARTKAQMNENVKHDEQANNKAVQLYMQAHRCYHCGAGFAKKKSLDIHDSQFKCSTKSFVCCQCKRQSFFYSNRGVRRVYRPTCTICNLLLPKGEDLLKHNLEVHKVSTMSDHQQKLGGKLTCDVEMQDDSAEEFMHVDKDDPVIESNYR